MLQYPSYDIYLYIYIQLGIKCVGCKYLRNGLAIAAVWIKREREKVRVDGKRCCAYNCVNPLKAQWDCQSHLFLCGFSIYKISISLLQ